MKGALLDMYRVLEVVLGSEQVGIPEDVKMAVRL
jgi:hypothetical protein